MKTERRHELQQNELADWLAEKVVQAKEHAGVIWATVLGVVVLVSVGMYMSRRSANQTAVAWEEFFNASSSGNADQLRRLADAAPDSEAGKWARLGLADQSLQQGIDQLFQDPTAARKSLIGAVESYRWVREHGGDKLLEERAALGLAKAYESQDKLPEARQEYEKLLKAWPDSVFASEAKHRLQDLDKKSTREFYDWFAQREVRSLDNEPGVPGLKPKFDASNLPPDESGIKFNNGVHAGSGKDSGPSLTPTQQFDKLRETTVTPEAAADAKGATPPAAGSSPPAAAGSAPPATDNKAESQEKGASQEAAPSAADKKDASEGNPE
ncbi:MAG TPA: hypothetical protein VHY20_04430 [Pirellulales bacterium]|jgi:predicted negative regulator of RcsB-dependent stress response|nr:hypothetical protein [Pirellulales bacterium]